MVRTAKTAEANMSIYHFDNAPNPWGDWGDILVHGTIDWDEDTDVDSIARVGPFTPPAYIRSGVLVLTDPIKKKLADSELKGISRYEHLEKTHIVKIDWSQWNTDNDITYYLDLEDGPSSIIYSRAHDAELANEMPEFWQAFITGKINLYKNPKSNPSKLSKYLQVVQIDKKADFFKGDIYGGYFVNERAKAWLDQHCPKCFDFTLIPTIA